jgi:lantibiotic modifying enzyme
VSRGESIRYENSSPSRKIDNRFDFVRKANRIARELTLFLKRTNADRTRRSSARDPIESALLPAVSFALERLRRVAPHGAKKLLAPSAWKMLSRHLANRLVFALTPVLRLEQGAVRAVSGRTDISLLEMFRAFPGALETVAQLIADWIDAQRELLTRVSRDHKKSRLMAIRPGLSDPHDGGRTVTLIGFFGNRRLIYKPRSCGGEQLWFAALRWLNRHGIEPSFRTPDLLPRKNYCWMEFLRTTNCPCVKAVRLFYFRWGAQAALAQILSASDLHRENWIAAGAQPILVDAETLGDANQFSRGGKKDRQAVPALLLTGLLLVTSRDRVGLYRGIGPFDTAGSEYSPQNCWPRYKGVTQPPAKYLDDLVNGFKAVGEIFANPATARKFFREIASRAARTTKARVFFRSSAEYARILRASLEPPHLISGRQRYRWLRQQCCVSAVSRSVARAEVLSLLRCDLPRFVARGRTVSWEQFSTALSQLNGSSQLLRRRVLFSTRIRRRRSSESVSLAI